MARFRFRIVDSTGRRRSGVVRAGSLEEAVTGLRSKHCQIEELTPLEDDGQGLELDRLEASFSLVDRLRRGLAITLGCVFLFSLVSWARTPKAPPPAPEAVVSVQLAVKGVLDTAAMKSAPASFGEYFGDASDLAIFVVFPELAYEVEGRVEQDGRSFLLEVSFDGAVRPQRALVEVALGDRRWPISATLAVPKNGDLDFGELSVTAPLDKTGQTGGGAVSPDPARKRGRR